jgi:hypothetical protein
MGSAKQTQSPKCNICVQAFVVTSWDAHGSYECYNEERGKKIIMCMHDDSKCLIKFILRKKLLFKFF